MPAEEAIKYLKAAQLTNGTSQTGFVGVPWAEVFETAIESGFTLAVENPWISTTKK